MTLTKTQKNVAKVLERMTTLALADPSYASMLADSLDAMLDNINVGQGFGPDGRDDPRGDFRNGEWAMYCVEGVAA